MIKFEEHEGLIFKMLDKPVPLKENDENVLVRFITHGIIGEYVMNHWLDCNQPNVPIYIDDVDSDGDVTVWIENENGNEEHHCCPFPMFEIIGTLVEEGSDDWAWYKMIGGEKIMCAGTTSQRFYAIKEGCDYCAFYESDGNEVSINTRRTYGEFIEYSKMCGISSWRIYKEPKPLLADAKVGDLVKLRNGSYSQIVEVEDGSVFKYQNPEVISSIALFLCDENGDTSRWGKVKDVDIIHTEPLAPEGSKDWAWQMMLLGKIIIHSEYRHENATWKMNNGTARSCLAGMSACSKEQWVANAIDNGWKIYEEQKEEPQPAKEPITKGRGMKQITIMLTNAEANHIETLIEKNLDDGVYWGSKEHHVNRSFRIQDKIAHARYLMMKKAQEEAVKVEEEE